jgi:hypothetical protein
MRNHQSKLAFAAALTCLATAVACGPTTPPELTGLSDQVAEVGTELDITLAGATHDGARLAYTYKAADLTDLAGQADITVSPDGTGEFRWTPLADDVGTHAFDFTAADGGATTTVTINIDVRSAIGAASAPVFRQPLGTGTTVDLTATPCVDIDVVVDDQDTANVTIAQEEPLIDGATLTAEGGQMAKWHWCPTKDQEAEDRYTLTLSADDGDNPKTIKNYLIVLRGGGDGSNCPGLPPTIDHTPQDETTNLDIALTATVTDDKGIKDAPLLYYTTVDPGSSPSLSTMTQLTTVQQSGDALSGTYVATVPNPVAAQSPGSSITLYYVFVADDDDDTMGNCDHTTTSQVYSETITSGGAAVAATCGTCTADNQCGAGNECVVIGNTGDSYCLAACTGGCASGSTCSTTAIESVDGASAKQCVPTTGSCVAAMASCQDDSWEDNDSRTEASHNPTMTTGDYDLVSCPSTTGANSDDDWFKIVTTGDSRVNLDLSGDGATDVDLHLYHSDGTVVTASTTTSPNESISECLPGATYYVKVNAFGHARSEYSLDYTSTPESCDTTCTDDSNEQDDTFSQARDATQLPYSSSDDEICPNNDDWYHVLLFTGQTMTVDLTFTQSDESGDLDLHLYSDGTTDLTPCDVNNPDGCSIANGQGAQSNEHTSFTVPSGCTSGCDYYVVVRGWDGATNNYSIAIDAE